MDVASNFCLLHAKLSKLGFDAWADVNEGDVMTGNPHTFACFLRFLYHRFPAATSALLQRYDWFLLETEDTALGATTVRLLSTTNPEIGVVSAAQFSQCKYAMVKINMCHALLRLLRSLTATPPPRLVSEAKAIASGEGNATSPLASRSADVQLRIKERRSALNSIPRS